MTDAKTPETASWQPIETAPLDGTEVDLWVRCVNPAHRPKGEEWRATDCSWRDGEWTEFDAKFGDMTPVANVHYRATHWMPIPDPPATELGPEIVPPGDEG